MIQFFINVCQVKDYFNILKLSCRPLTFTSYKAFWKNKKRSGTSFPASFSESFFFQKNSLAMFYLTKFHCLVGFTSWDIGQYVNCNCLSTRLWRLNCEINLIFLIKPFFLHGQKIKTKSWISWERKELLRWNKKHFSSFLKGFHRSE